MESNAKSSSEASFVAEVCDPVDRCPVCGSSERAAGPPQQRNRYSEEIAGLLDVEEEELLGAIRDVRCRQCGLGYKDWWFKPDFYYKVFVDAAPLHPRGWDAVLEKFTPARFQVEVERLGDAVSREDRPLVNRQRRTVQSYIDNIPRAQRAEPTTAEVLARYRRIDLDHVKPSDLDFLSDEVAPLIREPKPFGRFMGFNSDSLEALIRRHAPALASYAEVACPLWGLLPRFAGAGVETWILRDEDRAFWGPGCCDPSGRSCFEFARAERGVDHVSTLTELIEDGRRVDVLGILNYLDHLADPIEHLRRARKVSDRLLVVLVPDEPDTPGVIQHHTSFDDEVVRQAAERVGMSLAESLPCGEDPEPDFVAYLLT